MKSLLVVLLAGVALHSSLAAESSAPSGSTVLVLPTFVVTAPLPDSLPVRLAVKADALRAEAMHRPDLIDQPQSFPAPAVKLAEQQPAARTGNNSSS